jgi:hypothetical protein
MLVLKYWQQINVLKTIWHSMITRISSWSRGAWLPRPWYRILRPQSILYTQYTRQWVTTIIIGGQSSFVFLVRNLFSTSVTDVYSSRAVRFLIKPFLCGCAYYSNNIVMSSTMQFKWNESSTYCIIIVTYLILNCIEIIPKFQFRFVVYHFTTINFFI